MQLLIDTADTPISQLRAMSALLSQVADERASEPPKQAEPAAATNPTDILPAFAGLFGGVPAGTQAPLPLPTVPAPAMAPASTPTISPAPGVSPAIPTAGAPPTAPTADIDKAGLPWDERIHASSKAFVADGTWRKRKNLAPGVYDGVVAELRAQYPLPLSLQHVPPAAPIIVPPVPSDALMTIAPAPPPVIPPSLPTSTPNTGGTSGLPQDAAAGRVAFQNVAVKVANLVNAGKITNAQVPSIITKATNGLITNMQQLLSNPAPAAAVLAALDQAANGLLA